jgi:hypothetical protein
MPGAAIKGTRSSHTPLIPHPDELFVPSRFAKIESAGESEPSPAVACLDHLGWLAGKRRPILRVRERLRRWPTTVPSTSCGSS